MTDQEALDFDEWAHTGRVTDHLLPMESCQLCGQSNVRYHFEIAHRQTGATLQVGSSCIEKFDITVYDEQGRPLPAEARARRLRQVVRDRQQEMMLAPLNELWALAADRGRLLRCLAEFQQQGAFSPANLLYLFQMMADLDIAYTPALYKLSLRRAAERRQLQNMAVEDRELIEPALTPAQQQRGSPKAPEGMARPFIPDARRLRLPERPIRFNERAHRYTITFFDQAGQPVDRLFRGELVQARQFAGRRLAENSGLDAAEICLTNSGELVERLP